MQDREAINAPEGHADPRFNPEVGRRTGLRTRCSLALPLVDHRGDLVGVMQLLNPQGGTFGAADEALAAEPAAAG